MTTIKKHLLRGLSVLAAAVVLAASAGCNFNGEPGELPGKAAFTLEPMEDFPQDSTDGSEDNSSAEPDSDGDSSDNNGGESSDNSDAVSFAGSTWSSGDTYTGGMEVQHEGKIYRAKWWTQGDVPSASATDGPWEYVGEVSVTEPEPEETEPEIDDNTPDAPTKAGVDDFKIVGYYPSWEPDKVKYIQYDNLTHINYAFAIPQNDGTLLPLENPDAAKKIIKAAHKKGVKVLIAIGGWSYKEIPLEPNFVAATNSPEKIEKFAGEIMAMVDKYGFDGVDMDWEHPRRDGNSSQQYTQLMQTLSKQLHAKDKLLTSAVLSGVNADGGIYYDSSAHTDEVIKAVDWFNVMAYDGGDGERHSSYDFAVNSANYWKNTRKMPANKVVLGVPFYGRPSWKTYAEILAANPEAYNTDISTINGIQAHYNGIPTITKKTQWACDNVGGIMIWEISQDSTDKKTSLLNAIHETAKENKKVDLQEDIMDKKITFKYHPNVYDNEIVEKGSGVCDCCGKTVEEYCTTMYCAEEVECICLECISNGKAAEKFDGGFIQDAETDKVSDDSKTEELFKRTPGYASWQGEYWLACCDDYCAFIGDVGTKELEEMGIADEVFEEYDALNEYENAREYLVKAGSMAGYLFQCLHCGKYHLWVDAD